MSKSVSKASNRIMHLLTQATQAIEKGQLPVGFREMNGASAMVPAPENSLAVSLASGLNRGTSVMTEEELSEVCQAFNRMADAICKHDRQRLHFMAMAAHDLNNPLMVISGSARVLSYDDVPLQERRECLERLQRNVVALQYIVAELTDKVQAQVGQLRLHFEEVDLNVLVRKTVADFSASVSSHPITFEGDGACPILGDQQRLSRMLLNLLTNAVKYSDAGREISVAVWRRGAQVFLSVQDRGVGVSSSDVERMFLPFKRLEHTREMADGSGMGLVSVQKIVESHGAEIQVQGVPRQGTTVEIRFKIYSPTEKN